MQTDEGQDVKVAPDAEAGTESQAEFRKGRLVFQFPSSDQDAAIFFPNCAICVCTGPCAGHCSCGGGCIAVQADEKPVSLE
jgi:hypothetical protein